MDPNTALLALVAELYHRAVTAEQRVRELEAEKEQAKPQQQ